MEPSMTIDAAAPADAPPVEIPGETAPEVVSTANHDESATTVLKLDDSVQVTSAADTTQDAATSAPAEGGIEIGDDSGGIVLESHKSEAQGEVAVGAAVEAAPSIEAAPSFETAIAVEAAAPVEITAPIDVSVVAAEAAPKEPSEELPTFDFPVDGTVSVGAPQAETAPSVEFTTSAPAAQQPDPVSDASSEAELPYLFGKEHKKSSFDPLAAMGRALGDAIVPGGAASAPDVETLKKFLLLREQDVVALTTQLSAAIEHIKTLESQFGQEQSKVEALENENRISKSMIEDFESIKESEILALRYENQELAKTLHEKSEKTKMMELQVRATIGEIDQIKERVRLDIRRIRVREKELENRLEVVKKDAEQLILTREIKIVDLKRKLDTLEFNMDLVKEQMNREQEKARLLKQKLMKATAAFKNAEEMMSIEQEPVQEYDKTVVLKAS
ncbi:MAG: hypothetical protein KA715_13220 [Xanthomonadaceae bacterium]|nr:hypothetical protein [Xanthomonadaceae bacterium]